MLQLGISLQWEFPFKWECRKDCEFVSGGCICSPFIWSREHWQWCSINNIGTQPWQWNCTGSIFLYCIPVSILCLAEERKREKLRLIVLRPISYGKKGVKVQRDWDCYWALIFTPCLVVQEYVWFWLVVPFCLSSPDSFSSTAVPVSTDLTGECSAGQEENCQLCGQRCTELIISEELHNEKNMQTSLPS